MRASISLVTLMTAFIASNSAIAGAISSSGIPQLAPIIFQCEAKVSLNSRKIEVEVGSTMDHEHLMVVTINKGLVLKSQVSEFEDVKTLSGVGATHISGENFTFEVLNQNGSILYLKNADASVTLQIEGEKVIEMLKCTSSFPYLMLPDETRKAEAAL